MAVERILAIKFKFFGDIAVMVPSLRALRKAYPKARIDCLVPSETAAILEHIPWIDTVWHFPRKRGKAQWKKTIPLLYRLAKERYDISVDFVGNDRGALVSRLVGAAERVGPICPLGFAGRRFCYTLADVEAIKDMHETKRDLHVLKPLGIAQEGQDCRPELYADPELEGWAKRQLPEGAILCHLSTSMPKKEWPLARWQELFEGNEAWRERFVFTSGPSAREQAYLDAFLQRCPGARCVRTIPSVAHFMALIGAAGVLVNGDSLSAHLAAGLGTPQVCIMGPSLPRQWDPQGERELLLARPCQCIGHPHVCEAAKHCLLKISAEQVAEGIAKYLA